MGPIDSSSTTLPTSGSGASDPGALIAALTGQGQSAEQMRALATRASIPVPGGGGQEMPASLMYNPKQFTPAPQDHSPTIGKGSGRAQGIGNSVIGVLNAVGAVKNQEDNKKKLQIATDTHTLLMEQNNISQATQAMQALPQDDPQRKTLQAAIDASKQRQQGILADKKTRDAIAKGFHIDFTDPQANNTPDHQAVQQGQKMAEQSLSYADQFAQKAPANLGPNTVAQAQYASAVQQQQLQQKTMQAFIPLVRAMMQQQTAENKDQNAFTREQYHEAMENARNLTANQTKFQTTMAQIQSRADLAKTQFGYRMAEIGAEGNKQIQVFTEELTMKQGDPLKQIQTYEKFKVDTANTESKLSKAVTDAVAAKQQYLDTANKGHIGSNNGDPQVIKDLDNQINAAKGAQKSFSDATDAAQKYYNQLAGVKEGGPGGDSSTDNSSSFSSASTYLNAPDDEDEDDDNDSGTH